MPEHMFELPPVESEAVEALDGQKKPSKRAHVPGSTDAHKERIRRRRECREVLVPFSPHFANKAFAHLTPGTDWKGWAKSELANEFGEGRGILKNKSIEDLKKWIVVLLNEEHGFSVKCGK
jgi:hypothetical protein